MKMEMSMKGLGVMISKKVMAPSSSKQGIFTKGSGSMDWKAGLESIHLQMEITILATSSEEADMAKVTTNGQMAAFTKENGPVTAWMASVDIKIATEYWWKDTSLMMSSREHNDMFIFLEWSFLLLLALCELIDVCNDAFHFVQGNKVNLFFLYCLHLFEVFFQISVIFIN